MKKLKLLSIFILLLFLSCDKTSVYQQSDTDFKDNRWLKSDIKTHTIEIVKENSSYSLIFEMRHVIDFQFPEIPIQFKIESPDGTVNLEKISLLIKDANGKDKGECMGDVCDLKQVVFANKELAKGIYTISISNKFGSEYVPNVIGIGLRLEENEVVEK